MPRFTAIDFETATYGGESACALGLVRVEQGQIVGRDYFKIRPPSHEFRFTHIHGLTWADVEQEPDFGGVWPRMSAFFTDVDFIAAHNSGFDAGVLAACCARHGLSFPNLPFVCTVRLARQMWQLRPARLPDVCRYLSIPLRHHAADSDSEACARIVIAALEDGWRFDESSTGASRVRQDPH
jgi:DNA polymerase III subunit epsilon